MTSSSYSPPRSRAKHQGHAASIERGLSPAPLGFLALLFAAFLLTACRSNPPRPGLPVRVRSAPSALSQGFQPALAGYHFHFPADSGAHPAYKTEWWYYTGHLQSEGHEYGFELTFFRVGLEAHPRPRASRWAASAIYLAHFAITDINGGQFHYAERLDRGALGLAGADTGEEHVWIRDWSASASPGAGRPGAGRPGAGRPELWLHHLHASTGFGGIDLTLTPLKPPVIQGRNGISLKGPGYGQSSHYYSYTRLAAAGKVTIDGVRRKVAGLAWMDHEFGSSELAADEVGWDWFSVQLDSGWDLMLYQLRLAGPGGGAATRTALRGGIEISPFSSGALVSPVGAVTFLRRQDFAIRAGGAWTSPKTGITYPARWELSIPLAHLLLKETPRLADQELASGQTEGVETVNDKSSAAGAAPRGSGVIYWEGAVSVQGEQDGRAVGGEGYTELTGYGGPLSQLR